MMADSVCIMSVAARLQGSSVLCCVPFHAGKQKVMQESKQAKGRDTFNQVLISTNSQGEVGRKGEARRGNRIDYWADRVRPVINAFTVMATRLAQSCLIAQSGLGRVTL